MGMGRWVVLSLFCLLALAFALPQVRADSCCLDPTLGTCVKESTYTSTAAYNDYCRPPNQRMGVTPAGQCIGECATVCCCAISEKAGLNWRELNKDETILQTTSFACTKLIASVSGAYMSKTLPPGGNCVAVCAGTTGPGPVTQTYPVSGTILLGSGSTATPISGAEVSIQVPGTSTVIRGTTDAAGRYTLQNVPAMTGLTVRIVPPAGVGCPRNDGPFAVTGPTTRPDYSVVCSGGPGPGSCSPTTPALAIEPGTSETSKQLKVNATNAASCGAFRSFTVFQCQDTNDATCARRIAISPVATSTAPENRLSAEGLDPTKNHCFVATAYYTGGPVASKDSNRNCTSSGSSQCVGRTAGEQFCRQNTDGTSTVMQCGTDGNAQSGATCSGTQVCIESSYNGMGAASCQQSPCAACSGLAGLFARYDIAIGNPQCAAYKQTSISNSQACTLTRNTTHQGVSQPLLIDAFDSCARIRGCEQYTDPVSCANNRCGNDRTACQWSTLNAELGFGMCTTRSSTTVSTCSQCDDVYGSCTEALCAQVGARTSTTCYFTTQPGPDGKPLGCVGAQEMACLYYESQSDCIGASTGARFDVQYASADIRSRSGGTHRSTSASLDRLRIGACSWHTSAGGNRCIKNGDNWLPAAGIDDCQDTSGAIPDPTCVGDNTPPRTVLALTSTPYEVSALTKLGIGATDNRVPPEKIKTYVCFSETTQPCYPKKTLAEGDGLPTPAQLPKGQTRQYLVRYYSDDGHGNLEVVQQQPVSIIGDGIPRLDTVDIKENT